MLKEIFEAVIFDCSFYCVNHLPEGVKVNDARVTFVGENMEFDEYPICEKCGKVFDFVTLVPTNEENGKVYNKGEIRFKDVTDGYNPFGILIARKESV